MVLGVPILKHFRVCIYAELKKKSLIIKFLLLYRALSMYFSSFTKKKRIKKGICFLKCPYMSELVLIDVHDRTDQEFKCLFLSS